MPPGGYTRCACEVLIRARPDSAGRRQPRARLIDVNPETHPREPSLPSFFSALQSAAPPTRRPAMRNRRSNPSARAIAPSAHRTCPAPVVSRARSRQPIPPPPGRRAWTRSERSGKERLTGPRGTTGNRPTRIPSFCATASCAPWRAFRPRTDRVPPVTLGACPRSATTWPYDRPPVSDRAVHAAGPPRA